MRYKRDYCWLCVYYYLPNTSQLAVVFCLLLRCYNNFLCLWTSFINQPFSPRIDFLLLRVILHTWTVFAITGPSLLADSFCYYITTGNLFAHGKFSLLHYYGQLKFFIITLLRYSTRIDFSLLRVLLLCSWKFSVITLPKLSLAGSIFHAGYDI